TPGGAVMDKRAVLTGPGPWAARPRALGWLPAVAVLTALLTACAATSPPPNSPPPNSGPGTGDEPRLVRAVGVQRVAATAAPADVAAVAGGVSAFGYDLDRSAAEPAK